MDHRRHHRHRVCFPIQIDAIDKRDRFGITRNVSASGMLVGTRSRFSLGQRLELTFRILPTTPEYSVRGRVVRIGRVKADQPDVYPRRVAIEFETQFLALVPEFRKAALHQAELYGLS